LGHPYRQRLLPIWNAGAEIVEGLELPRAKELNTSPYVLDVMLWDFKTDLENYLASYVDPAFPIHDLADALSFNRQHADQEMPWFGQDLFELAAGKGPLDAPEYLHMVSEVQRWGREEGIDALLRQHRLDALIAPTNTPAGRIDVVNRDGSAGGSSGVSAVAGYPIVTVPAGYAHGLPVGISFMGTGYSEPTLIRLAYAYEQATMHRREPTFAPGGIMPPG
jgi:amidase